MQHRRLQSSALQQRGAGAAATIDFADYDAGKTELAAMQHQKCCYCQKRVGQARYRDVDHYRPKAHYWWFPWTWENLPFSCVDCNREFKRDQFPLSAGTPLTAEEAPPGLEQPLVIDPTDPAVDPMAEIG